MSNTKLSLIWLSSVIIFALSGAICHEVVIQQDALSKVTVWMPMFPYGFHCAIPSAIMSFVYAMKMRIDYEA